MFGCEILVNCCWVGFWGGLLVGFGGIVNGGVLKGSKIGFL